MPFLKKNEKAYLRMKTSFWAALVLCLIAHGFTYANATFFHDRCTYAMAIEFTSAIRTKWMAQYWDYLFQFSYLPWLSGVLIILFFAVSIYIIADALETQHTVTIWLIAGVCITGKTVISAHMYWPHDMIAALFLAMVSVWTWKHEKISIPIRVAGGALFIALSLATYGAYTSAAPFIVMIVLLCSIVDGEKAKKVFLRGLEYVGTFLLGMVIYYIVLRLFLYFQDLEIIDYLSEARLMDDFPAISELLQLISGAYQSTLQYIQEHSLQTGIVLTAVLLILQLFLSDRKYSISDFAMMILLIGLMPICIGAIYIMSFGHTHFLMEFTYDISPVLAIALLDRVKYGRPFRADIFRSLSLVPNVVIVALLCAGIYRGILSSNMAYMQIEKIDAETKSITNRMMMRIESCEGFDGCEEIIFVGEPALNAYITYLNYDPLNPLLKDIAVAGTYRNGITYGIPLRALLRTDAGNRLPSNFYQPELYSANQQQQIREMSIYPADGSVQKIGDTIVVKFQELPEEP